MDSPENSAAALGLFRYQCDLPNASIFEAFYRAALAVFEECGIQPTYVGADGPRYSEQLEPLAGTTHNRLLETGFSDICGMSIVANPAESDSPAYDSFATISLSYLDTEQELLSSLCVEERFMRLHSPAYERILKQLLQLHAWDFGFGFRATVASQPNLPILGLDDGNLSPEAYQALCSWYDSSPDVRVTRLRDLYPDNVVNATQLAQRVRSESLQQVAERHGSLTPLAQESLFLWRLEEAELSRVRAELVGSGVLIASYDR